LCTECGGKFGDDEIVLFGWASGSAALISFLNTRARDLWIPMLALLIGLHPFLLYRRFRDAIALSPASIAWWACVILLFAVMLAPRYWQRVSEPLRLRLRGKGFRVEPTNVPPQRTRRALLTAAVFCVVLSVLSAPPFRPGEIIYLVMMGMLVARWYQQMQPETRVIPWDWCRSIVVKKKAGSRWFLQIRVDQKIAGVGRDLPASLELELTDEDADTLRQCLNGLSGLTPQGQVPDATG
jgi:hypothetical protein